MAYTSYQEKTVYFNLNYIGSHSWGFHKDTVLHEVAHAKVGPGNEHNEIWRKQARELGCLVLNYMTESFDELLLMQLDD